MPVSAAPSTRVSHVVPVHPHVPASVPAIVAADPHVTGSGPSRHGLVYRRRRPGLNVNVRLGVRGRCVYDGTRCTKNRCKKKLPHSYLSCPRVAAAIADASCYPAPSDFERSARTLTASGRRRLPLLRAAGCGRAAEFAPPRTVAPCFRMAQLVRRSRLVCALSSWLQSCCR